MGIFISVGSFLRGQNKKIGTDPGGPKIYWICRPVKLIGPIYTSVVDPYIESVSGYGSGISSESGYGSGSRVLITKN